MTARKLPSERSFGALFLCVTAALLVRAVTHQWPSPSIAGLSLVWIALALATLFAPRLLAPFNKGWFLLGAGLGKVTGGISFTAIFYLLISPVALVTRLWGRDELRLKPCQTDTYWIARKAPADPQSFRNQF